MASRKSRMTSVDVRPKNFSQKIPAKQISAETPFSWKTNRPKTKKTVEFSFDQKKIGRKSSRFVIREHQQKKMSQQKIAIFFDELPVFEDLPPQKVGIGSSVVKIHCARYLFQVCTMLHWREISTFVFSSSRLGEKDFTHGGVVQFRRLGTLESKKDP